MNTTVYPGEPIFGRDAGEIAPGDYAIWVHRDGAKTSACPWRLSDYDDAGAFSEADVAELANRYGFPQATIRALSRQIGHCLDRDTVVNLVEIKRSVAEARAKTRAKRAHNAAKRGEPGKAAGLIADLVDSFASEEPTSSALDKAKRLGAAAPMDKTAFIGALGELRETRNASFDMSPLDTREVWDDRRKHVVWECCALFRKARRPVTYMPVGDGTHGGPLVDFVQDVVRRVTAPSHTLSAGTIRRDIDLFKNPDPAVYRGNDPRAADRK